MTVAEIFNQAQTLTAHERKELAKLLIDTLDVEEEGDTSLSANVVSATKTPAEMAVLLESMEPIEFVDPEITDPVEWVKAQRRKEADRLKPYWGGEE